MGEDLKPRESIPTEPTGGVPLDDERMGLVFPQWEAMRRSIRMMDGLELGETEPSTVYIWWGCQP